MADNLLIRKYDVPGPRYTSYPTVPYWDASSFSVGAWKDELGTIGGEGIALYIHLPFCESLCTYCGCTTRITKNHGMERPYIQALLAEWELYLTNIGQAPEVKELHFGGGTPTFFSAKNLKYLVSELLKNNKEIPDISLEGHPNNTTEEHLEVMYRLGARRVSFGIQDFDPRVQELIHRIQPFDKVKEVTETARRIGYTSVNYDLIYGLPAQTLQTVTDTLDKTLSLKPDRIAFYSYAHVPWMKPAQKSFEAHLPNGEEKRTLYEWGKQHFMDAGYKEIGMDHFALPTDSLYLAHESGGLHRNFMGYTTQTTRYMIGLGASSISDLWTAFAQNEKSVEAYMARVNAGEFPIEKGHLLSSDDLMVRAHILDLMCRFRTDFTYNPALLADLKDRLVEMENDGLVEWRANTLAVLPKGEPFIRNVCMSLDLRLLSSRPSTQLFSQTV